MVICELRGDNDICNSFNIATIDQAIGRFTSDNLYLVTCTTYRSVKLIFNK